MAKKNEVRIGLKVDDKGSLKKTGKHARDMDRNLKGAAQASSNSTKNFSKMAQGISGGLVPAYATLAATMFAVSAVFRAFQKAADLRVQTDAMKAMGAATGRNMSIVAKSLQEATGHQIAFKEAAEASAIALSAGFSGSQVAQIGKMAKQTSAALGRDFQDTFDRLLKGISKAEPELLDELGIVLRLEKATNDYARAIGKSAKDLTAFERQQAVMNNVLQQASEKYGAIDVNINRVNAVAAKFEDIMNGVMQALAPIIEFLADTLGKNTETALAAIGVFVAYIVGKMIPTFGAMREQAVAAFTSIGAAATGAASAVRTSWRSVKAGWKVGGRAIKAATGTSAEAGAAAGGRRWGAAKALEGTKSKTLQRFAGGGALSGRDVANMKKMIANFKKQGKEYTGFLKGQSRIRVRIWEQQLKYQQTSFAKHMGVIKAWTKMGWKVMSTTVKVSMKVMTGAVKLGVNVMKVAFKGLGLAVKAVSYTMNAAMRAAGFIGLIMLIWDLFTAMKDHMDKIMLAISKILKWIGDKIEAFGEKIAGFLEMIGMDKLASMTRSAASGLAGKIAGERNPETGEREGGWAGKAEAKGLSVQAANVSKRALDDLKAKFEDFTKSIKDANTELRANAELLDGSFTKIANFISTSGVMGNLLNFQSLLARVKEERERIEASMRQNLRKYDQGAQGYWPKISEDQKAKRQAEWEAYLAKLAVNEAALSALNATSEEGRTSALNTLKNQLLLLNNVAGGDERMGKIFEELRKAEPDWVKIIEWITQFTHEWGAHTASVQAAKNMVESYDKALGNIIIKNPEISKHFNNLRQLSRDVVSGTKDILDEDILKAINRYMGEAVVKRIEELGLIEGKAYALEQIKKAMNDQINQATELLKLEHELTLLKTTQAKMSRFGGGFGSFLQRKGKIAQGPLDEQIADFNFQKKFGAGSEWEVKVRNAAKEQNTEHLANLKMEYKIAEQLLEINKENIAAYEWQTSVMGQLATTTIDGFVNALHQAVTSTKDLKTSFAEMARSILANLARMIIEQMVFNAIAGIINRGGKKSTSSTTVKPNDPSSQPVWGPPRTGEIEARYGGVFDKYGRQSFGAGGIAKGPGSGYAVMLHGAEAVVPLVGGKSIPVEMKGGGGVNNVSVSVHMAEGGGSRQDVTSDGGAELGKVIASVVQKELQNQKRQGGILNPHGVA